MADRADFVECVWPHRTSLLKTALRYYKGNKHSAEDLVQATFVRAFQRWNSCDTPNVREWLYRFQYSCFVNERSKQRRKPLVLGRNEDIASAIVSGANEARTPSAETEFFATGFRGDLGRALQQMNPDFTQAVVLFDGIGFTQKQIAERLGIPSMTVGTRIYRGRQQLRALLGHEDASPAMDR